MTTVDELQAALDDATDALRNSDDDALHLAVSLVIARGGMCTLIQSIARGITNAITTDDVTWTFTSDGDEIGSAAAAVIAGVGNDDNDGACYIVHQLSLDDQANVATWLIRVYGQLLRGET